MGRAVPVVSHETRVREVLDPLTRASVGLQRFGNRAGGSAVTLFFGALLVLEAARPLPRWVVPFVAGAGLVALWGAALRRLRPTPSRSVARLEFEAASLATVFLVHAVLHMPSGLDGAFAGLLYIGAVVLAALARPAASAATWAFLAALLLTLEAVQGGSLSKYLPLWTLLGASGAITIVALRRELARSERSSRQALDREVEKLREAARSYRLTAAGNTSAGAAAGAAAAAVVATDDERLLRSSVDEIHAALCSALSLCRVALASRSVIVLWLDDSGERLHLRAASSEAEKLEEGPFAAQEGIFAAALESPRPMQLVGASLIRPLPYYSGGRSGAEHVALLPILEDGRPSGLLVIDRRLPVELTPAELEILSETERLVRRTVDNERVVLQLDRAQVEQGRLYRAVERLNEARSEVQVIEAGVSSARDFAAFQFAAVTLLRAAGEHEICAVSGEGADALVGKSFRDPTGLVGMVVENRHPLPYRGQAGGMQVLFTRSLPTPRFSSLLVLPLIVHQEVLGTLVLGSEEPGGFGADVRLSLQVLARHVAVSLANARMVKRLEELATTDGLTGLYNKRTLTEIGRQKLRSAKRFQKVLSVLICDLDHFKAVNDTHGHDVGDRVIRGFAEVLRRTKRETDAVGRFGGEEFVLVCEQTDTVGAEQLAERIQAELRATTFVTAQSSALRVTCSIGVATYPAGGEDWETLFKATDEALYASKRGGRDRVTVWSSRLRSAKAS